MSIFTFWEGKMPGYIRLCMDTWKVPVVVLNYDILNSYTSLPISNISRFNLSKVADIVRVHVLRDQGGYWLDADTIMLTDKLPDTDFVGDPEARDSSIGLLYSKPHSEMFEKWAEYQDYMINSPDPPAHWSTFANDFSDPYLKVHPDVRIHPIENYWPETYMIPGDIPRQKKYGMFYFENTYHLADIRRTDLLMLHNSWTPAWYKNMSAEQVLEHECTMSNILREVLLWELN